MRPLLKHYQLGKQLTYILVAGLLLLSATTYAQNDRVRQIGDKFRQVGGSFQSGSGGDSLKQRNKHEDSITISYRYLDSSRNYKLDSSIGDFTKRFPLPATYIHLGNTGNAARSLLFSPILQSGFDAGFHGFDAWQWKLETVRFFQTTRPYSEINYMLGSKAEQVIELLHTQNIKPSWNFAFNYRLINSPGFFQSQKTNHNNYLLTSKFQTKNLRYNNYLVLLGNKMLSGENGGIIDTFSTPVLQNPDYKDRYIIPTYIGPAENFSANFFSKNISTGNKYSLFTALMRQQYDLGKKDSVVTDSTVIPLFYPRLRFEHTIQLEQQRYTYLDYIGDSLYYKARYDTSLNKAVDTLVVKDRWQVLTNDFSIYQFPDAKNLQQFIKLGAMLQLLTGEFNGGKENFVNTAGHAEYRNRSKNQRWDISAYGKLFFTGLNAGDYDAHISVESFAGKKAGYIKLGFENASRTPSFVFDNRSSFYYTKTLNNFKKENNTHLYASYYLPSFKFRITGHYYLVSNYTYLTNYYQMQQESSLFNVLQVAVEKSFKVGKRWNWHTEVYFQQVVGDGPVNVPVIYTRNRFAYEGNLGFKNLDIAMGTEVRYRAAYKADGYSPLHGRFFYQDSVRINNNLPDISAYVHFRIRPMKFFIRAENLNTMNFLGGFGFTRNNLVAQDYPLPGLQIRVGVWWGFVN